MIAARQAVYGIIPGMLLSSLLACDDPLDPLAPSFMLVNPPASVSASAVAFNQINLTWQDVATNETGFEIYRSPGAGGAFTLLVTTGAGATSYGDFGLAALTAYCYKVRTLRVTGKKNNYSDFSATVCATTPRKPVPLAASGVNAAPVGSYAISIVWLDNSNDESGFRLEHASNASGPWSTLGNLGAGATSSYDYYPAVEQNLCYRVFAFNIYGDADPSNVDCTAMPAAPGNLTANVTGVAVDLAWTDNSAVEDGVDVLRDDGSGLNVIAHLPANAISYHDAGVTPDQTYSYGVRATKDGGTSVNSNSVQVVVAATAPLAPSNASAYPFYSNRVVVYWTDGSTNEAGFRVERSTDGGNSWVAAGNVGINETAFSDYGLVSEQAVCYRVIAYNGLGDSPAANTNCTTPPLGPTDFTGTPSGDNNYLLTWSDNSNVEGGYQVIADDGYGSEWVVADLPANATTVEVSADWVNYYYLFVVASKDGGWSDPSNWFPSAPPPQWWGNSVRASAAPVSQPKRPMLPRRAKP